jgi:hypothetical protein
MKSFKDRDNYHEHNANNFETFVQYFYLTNNKWSF